MPKRIGIENFTPAAPVPTTHSNIDDLLKSKSGGFSLSAFAAFPKTVTFEGENGGEEIILLVRRHIITNVVWVLAVVISLFAPLFIFPILFNFNILPPLPAGFKIILFLFWYLGTATYALLNFLSWYFNVGIVTDERVVDIDWNSLTHRETTTAMLSKIQDVTPSFVGVLGGIFDYGHVHIQTAGTFPNIEFLSIPHPQLVANKIQDLTQKEEKEWETKP